LTFDLNAAKQTSSTPKDSKKGMTFKTMAVKTDDSLPYWDLNNNYLERSGGGSLKDGQFYTHAYVLKWRVSDKGWRTLLRHNNDHCIIVRDGGKDLGMYSNRKSGFRDSGYNIVPQNNFWEIVLVTGKGSSANTHAGVSTLYTLDDNTGEMVKRGTSDRVCSGNTYYRIGWPGQGPGKIARALTWNRVLSDGEIQQVGTALSATTCKDPCKSRTMKTLTFDLNAAKQTSSTPKDSKKGMTFKTMAVKTDDSLPYWDLNNNYLERSGGGSLKDGQFYTHAYVLKWRVSDKGWRTLLRHNNDHCIIVRDGGKDLGMYSNRKSGFRDSGYNIVPQNNFWEIVVVTGKGSSATSHTGVSTLYTLDGNTGKMVKRGTVDRVCSGNTYYRIGYEGQGPGKIARALSWNRVLSDSEIDGLAKTLTTTCTN